MSKKIKVVDVMKVIDIDASAISKATFHYLNNFYATYRDIGQGEHLYDIVIAAEFDQFDCNYLAVFSKRERKVIRKEIGIMGKLAADKDAAYVRFIGHIS